MRKVSLSLMCRVSCRVCRLAPKLTPPCLTRSRNRIRARDSWRESVNDTPRADNGVEMCTAGLIAWRGGKEEGGGALPNAPLHAHQIAEKAVLPFFP